MSTLSNSPINNFSYIPPDLTFSVCSLSDISIWKKTSEKILEFIDSKNYAVIVPDNELIFFRLITNAKIKVIPETHYIGNLREILQKQIPTIAHPRIGWYLQQFIKLAILRQARKTDNYLIWDADTIPIKDLFFFESTGAVQFYTGTEFHPQYFTATEKILNLGKIAPFSFIAQCFPCKGSWAIDFFRTIEDISQKDYINSIISNIDFQQNSGFSEYETLGTFIYENFKNEIIIKKNKWLRHGKSWIGFPENINRSPYSELIREFDHVTFEKWDAPFSSLKTQKPSFLQHFLLIKAKTKQDLDGYINDLFQNKMIRSIVQIGANDGVQNDPLRKYLVKPGEFETTLIEPIPYYISKLKSLYINRNDINIFQAAAGSRDEIRKLFFIDPEIANEMNGDGPANNWAHGQGAFDKKTVMHWILANQFRGASYVSNIDKYINAIKTIEIKVKKTEQFLPLERAGLLVVIDVQGFEIEVLNGINWICPPRWILVEDDLGNTLELINYFQERGFFWVAGHQDKLFTNS